MEFSWSWLTCAKWCLCLRLGGKGLSLLASGGTIFTAYLLQLEIFPVGKAKNFTTLNLHVLAGACSHLGVANTATRRPVCPGEPCYPVGWGGAMPWGWSQDTELSRWAPSGLWLQQCWVRLPPHTPVLAAWKQYDSEKKPFSLTYLFNFINLSIAISFPDF